VNVSLCLFWDELNTKFIKEKQMSKLVALLCAITIVLATGCAPKTFVKTPPGWKTIEFNENIKNDFNIAWQKSVDTIAKDYDLEMVDKSSGYLRTSWIYGISGGQYNRYRGRITVKFPELVNPTKVDVKTEAQWLSEVQYGVWEPGWDQTFQRDVYTALSGRLGRTVASE
jgi:hypothetical protein